jgi:hypothetical protein
VSDQDEYDLFLQTWEPGELLRYSTLPQNLNDPVVRTRLFEDSSGNAPVERAEFIVGKKAMAADELTARAFEFFQDHHEKWAAEFRDYVLSKDVPIEKLDAFVTSFAKSWVDGMARRQSSPEMRAIKASIRDYDLLCYPTYAGQFVIKSVDDSVPPLLSPREMAVIFDANSGLLDSFMPDYIDHLGSDGPSSLDEIFVRRGVYMPTLESIRKELHYLSSYSLTLGPVEQFAQTWNSATRETGTPVIFSAPMSAIQNRVVAFAPFIEGMDIGQLEFVVAPPVDETPLQQDGMHGGIQEFSFR